MATKYRAGDSDASLRQMRAYLKVCAESSTPTKRLLFLSLAAEEMRKMDEFLSRGEPLPAAWERRRGVDLTGSEAGEARGRKKVKAPSDAGLSREGANA